MVEDLKRSCGAVGAALYPDSDPHAQIDRIFEIAREFDIDIDMHLDFGPDPDDLDLLYVCEKTETFKYGGGGAVGPRSKLSGSPPPPFAQWRPPQAGGGGAAPPPAPAHPF